jgi:hypothetical protein
MSSVVQMIRTLRLPMGPRGVLNPRRLVLIRLSA